MEDWNVTTKVIIDGKEYEPSLPLKFKAIKRVFPLAKQAQAMLERREEEDFDPLALASVTIEIVSAALVKNHPECTPEFIEENCSMQELAALNGVFAAIMAESGFTREAALQGEAEAEEGAASPSTETSTA